MREGAAPGAYAEYRSIERLIPFGLALAAPVLSDYLMDKLFDPGEFVSKMQSGAFDGRLHDELAKLSREQLEQVAMVLSERARIRDVAGT